MSFSLLLRLAARNLLRNPRRILLSLVSVVAGVAVYILGQGFVVGMKENMLRAQIDSVSGHVALRPAGYPTDGLSAPLDDRLVVTPEAAAWLDDNTVAWTRRVLFAPEAIAGMDSLRLRGIVFDPARDETVFQRTDWRVTGEVPVDADDGVLVGAGVADLLDLETGEWMTLRARTMDGAINALEVPVAGVLRSGNPMIDMTSVLLPWALGDQLLLGGEQTTHVNARLADRDDTAAFVEAALGGEAGAARFPGAEGVTWQTETAELARLQDIRQKIMQVLAFILLAMAATGIANTILMAAYERIREVGTLRALGMTRGGVVRLFVLEGALLGLVGATIGTVIGAGLVAYWTRVGIDLSPMMEGSGDSMSNFPISTTLYMSTDVTQTVVGFLFGLGIAVFASVYPAFAATWLAPAEAVRA
jgi:putative ABC transport system permease protein